MKACAHCKSSKDFSEFYKSKRFRDGLRTWCKACEIDSAKEWNAKNKERCTLNLSTWKKKNVERELAWRKDYYQKNLEELRAKSREYWLTRTEQRRANNLRWSRANADKKRESARQWAAANRERSRARAKAWAQANHGRVIANARLREAREKRAMPKWANRFFIGEIYDLANLRTKLLGVPHHVDHIVPLVSPLVCGLHVENNLRVVPASINRAKSNSHWPDKP